MDPIMYLKVFAVGGAICVLAQLLVVLTKITPARILVIFLIIGIVLETIGVYKYLTDFAGAGASVPISGFGSALAKGAIKGADENGFLGALGGAMKETAVGLSAAIFFSYIIALIFKPRTKKR